MLLNTAFRIRQTAIWKYYKVTFDIISKVTLCLLMALTLRERFVIIKRMINT